MLSAVELKDNAMGRQAKPKAYDIMAPTCPSRVILNRIGARWTIFVVVALAERPKRFGELKTHIRGITSKALTETLRAMARDGLIQRTEYEGQPPPSSMRLPRSGARCWSRWPRFGSGPKTTCPKCWTQTCVPMKATLQPTFSSTTPFPQPLATKPNPGCSQAVSLKIPALASYPEAHRVTIHHREGTMSQPNSFWPNAARLAVTVSMQFEAGGQPISGAGGPITEPILQGYPDLGQNSFYEYGAREVCPGSST